MPKCKKCDKIFPSQFLVQIESMLKDPEALKCVYCDQNINTIITKVGGNIANYTKEQCIKDYTIFLKKLAEQKNISEVLSNTRSPIIIKP